MIAKLGAGARGKRDETLRFYWVCPGLAEGDRAARSERGEGDPRATDGLLRA